MDTPERQARPAFCFLDEEHFRKLSEKEQWMYLSDAFVELHRFADEIFTLTTSAHAIPPSPSRPTGAVSSGADLAQAAATSGMRAARLEGADGIPHR
jgi:hypothetical protein